MPHHNQNHPHHDHPHRDRLHRLARTAAQAAFRGAATAAGTAPIQLAIWWIAHR